jgi:hypothetical protein
MCKLLAAHFTVLCAAAACIRLVRQLDAACSRVSFTSAVLLIIVDLEVSYS